MTRQGGRGMTSIGINELMALYSVARGFRIGQLQILFHLDVFFISIWSSKGTWEDTFSTSL